MTPTYQAWQIHPVAATTDEKSPEVLQNLQIHTIPKPIPGPRQALVRIHAASLNYRDLLTTAFSPKYPVPTVPGLSPCSDGAGSVEAVGEESKWSPGDEVLFVLQNSWVDGDVSAFDFVTLGGGSTQGLLQQYRLIDDALLVKKPKHLDWEEAAALAGAGATAVNALFHSGVSSPGFDLSGKTVLTQGSGGVSCAAVQLAAAAGARVIATSSSEEKLKLLKGLGASDLINYQTHPEWADEVLKLTHGRGVDLVVDVAGAGTIEQSLRAVRQGGTVVILGFLTESKTYDVVFPLILGAKIVRGLLVASSEMYKETVALAEKYKIVPYIGERFGWSQAREALSALRSGKVVGKITIKV
ncbi:uncharacterized protein PV09_08907 [Verruconis gallopava]|uniref:Enoyl reductase (ER) domain-containing protein n=1 Tax=Verruconis gallopava TaxID=253628 RepID=A0A0D1YF27_9PEZI|nr:uncharacterized protein PV09_08907 [Verruconis gallopava]KIV99361.1 hypothetical protein PV09_08907 [Verruconis gallopava]